MGTAVPADLVRNGNIEMEAALTDVAVMGSISYSGLSRRDAAIRKLKKEIYRGTDPGDNQQPVEPTQCIFRLGGIHPVFYPGVSFKKILYRLFGPAAFATVSGSNQFDGFRLSAVFQRGNGGAWEFACGNFHGYSSGRRLPTMRG